MGRDGYSHLSPFNTGGKMKKHDPFYWYDIRREYVHDMRARGYPEWLITELDTVLAYLMGLTEADDDYIAEEVWRHAVSDFLQDTAFTVASGSNSDIPFAFAMSDTDA